MLIWGEKVQYTIEFWMLDIWQPPHMIPPRIYSFFFAHLVIRFLLSAYWILSARFLESKFISTKNVDLLPGDILDAKGDGSWNTYNWLFTCEQITRNFDHMFRFSCCYYYYHYYLNICRCMWGSTAKVFVHYFSSGTSNEPEYLEITIETLHYILCLWNIAVSQCIPNV